MNGLGRGTPSVNDPDGGGRSVPLRETIETLFRPPQTLATRAVRGWAMTDTSSLRTRNAADHTGPDPLGRLVSRIAAGDRAAFRHLYGFLALPVWQAATRRLSDPADALAVARATFLDIWHLARHHDPDREDIRDWISSITERRADDRRRSTPDPLAGVHDAHAHLQLADLLGTGRGTVRVGPGAFVSVTDLDDMLAAVAEAWQAATASDAADSSAA